MIIFGFLDPYALLIGSHVSTINFMKELESVFFSIIPMPKGMKLYDLDIRKNLVSRDVVFSEKFLQNLRLIMKTGHLCYSHLGKMMVDSSSTSNMHGH